MRTFYDIFKHSRHDDVALTQQKTVDIWLDYPDRPG